MEVSRKRKLSAEATFLPQLKCYVDENIQNKQSEKKMQEIYSRTVNLLFKGAQQKQMKQMVDKSAKFREIKTLEGNLVNGGKMPDWFLAAPVLVCNTCMSNSKLEVDCNNCNMNICERCGYACMQCKEPLCHTCVNLFNCNRGTADLPVCQRCASY